MIRAAGDANKSADSRHELLGTLPTSLQPHASVGWLSKMLIKGGISAVPQSSVPKT
jgi:hypothetical protein